MKTKRTLQRRRNILALGVAGATLALSGCAAPLSMKEHFVLVHGQWHGAWCWSKVVPLLQAQGHRVTAIDLPGRGGDVQDLAKLTPADYVAAVTRVLDAAPEPVVLVGHSLGGGTVSLAGEARPDKIKRLVYLTAFLVPPGKTMGSIAMSDKHALTAKAVRRDAQTGLSSLDPAFVREVFYQDCSDADVAMATRMVTAESGAMGRAPILVTPERYGRIKRVYVECLQDRAISLSVQRAMVAAMPCEKVLTLNTSHSPFFSDPAGVVQALTSS
ncbi:alpha/beta fold hydrolase [Variovorax sp. V213]|uniref:alpha/beta fold hydrolase n=1 Tax=Variovorax sp. V213 TaxID=3065955 RepID=UPI0034E8A2A5